MGADNFIVFIGLRYNIVADDEIDRVETRNDSRLKAAQRAHLDTYLGRPTEGEPFFLLIGTKIGRFGVQGTLRMELSDDQLRRLAHDTTAKLTKAGLQGEAKLHLQFEAQF